MDIMPADPTSVYRYYDKSGLLLYVGITSRATKRQREHNGDKEWWPLVTSQEVEHYPTRALALSRERQLIIGYRPPFNTQHNPDHENLRALYLAARESLPAHPALVQAFHAVGGRIPLTQVSSGNVATFAAPEAFRLLIAAAVPETRDKVLLLAPRKKGVLTDVRLVELQPLINFTGERGGITSLTDVHLRLKVVTAKPFRVRIYEATGRVA